jgi:hypothetical protein
MVRRAILRQVWPLEWDSPSYWLNFRVSARISQNLVGESSIALHRVYGPFSRGFVVKKYSYVNLLVGVPL